MMDCIDKICFPVLDISMNNWSEENVSELIFYDIYFYNKSYDLFERLRLNHKVIDSNGCIFRIIRLQKRSHNWINFFEGSKYEMIFQLLDETIGLDDLKDFMANRISNLEVNEYKFKWLESINKAKSFKELIATM